MCQGKGKQKPSSFQACQPKLQKTSIAQLLCRRRCLNDWYWRVANLGKSETVVDIFHHLSSQARSRINVAKTRGRQPQHTAALSCRPRACTTLLDGRLICGCSLALKLKRENRERLHWKEFTRHAFCHAFCHTFCHRLNATRYLDALDGFFLLPPSVDSSVDSMRYLDGLCRRNKVLGDQVFSHSPYYQAR